MKKTIAALALSAVMLTAMPLTVFAHGHSHGTDSSAACNSLCSVENCNETGNHQHDGVTYSGHYIGDGHDYHQACTTEGCTGPAAMSTMELSACPTAGMTVTALPAPTIMEAIMAGTIIKSQESQSLIS